MGQLLASGAPPPAARPEAPRLSSHDAAVLTLKRARDRVKKYRISVSARCQDCREGTAMMMMMSVV